MSNVHFRHFDISNLLIYQFAVYYFLFRAYYLLCSATVDIMPEIHFIGTIDSAHDVKESPISLTWTVVPSISTNEALSL